MEESVLRYDLFPGAEAFSTLRPAGVPRRSAPANGLAWPVLQPLQVHGDRIVAIETPTHSRMRLHGYDAIVTPLTDFGIGVRTADCIPLLLYDPVRRVVGAVHSGWRGTVARIGCKTIGVMAVRYGTRPADIRALVGPGIGPEDFQVGEDLVERFREEGFPMEEILRYDGERIPGTMRGGWHVDLWRANGWLRESVGVPSGQIKTVGISSYADRRFHSARRDGPDCGRTVTAIRLI